MTEVSKKFDDHVLRLRKDLKEDRTRSILKEYDIKTKNRKGVAKRARKLEIYDKEVRALPPKEIARILGAQQVPSIPPHAPIRHIAFQPSPINLVSTPVGRGAGPSQTPGTSGGYSPYVPPPSRNVDRRSTQQNELNRIRMTDRFGEEIRERFSNFQRSAARAAARMMNSPARIAPETSAYSEGPRSQHAS